MNRSGTDALLISPQVDLDTIGLKQLHQVLLNKGFSSILLYLPGCDGQDGKLLDSITTFVESRLPKFIGISLMSHEYSAAARLTGRLKQNFPEVPVIWGGVHATIAPEMCLEHADYVCVGEGEAAVAALADSLRQGNHIEGIANLWHVREERLIPTPLAPLLEDLDALPPCGHRPSPAYVAHRGSIVPLDKSLFKHYARWRGTVYSIMGSRGCPFSCAYCCNDFLARLYDAKKVRRRSVPDIIAELSRAIRDNPGIYYINFQDDCFLACSDEYLRDFCRAYQKEVGRPFIVRCIPSFINETRLKQLQAAGLAWISLGLQSGNDSILKGVYNRRSTGRQFLEAAQLVNKLGIAAYYDIIVDNPLESDADRQKTVALLTAVPRPFFLQLFSLTLYPGTALRERIIPDYPELAEDYLRKNYHRYQPTFLNRIIRLSGYMPPGLVRKLAAEAGQPSSRFRIRLTLAGLVSALVMEPVAYFRVIRRSQHGSIWAALKQLPVFFRVGISRYVKQFSGPLSFLAERAVRDEITSHPDSAGKSKPS
ncbi:MAG: radical SAM protein [Desulfosudaceae bacterium]